MFCQTCGAEQRSASNPVIPQPTKTQKPDLDAIDKRIHELHSARISTRYGRQKSSLERELQSFLATLTPSKTIFSCVPNDVIRYLVWKDRNGRTKVHQQHCQFLGSRLKGVCDCPSHLAAGTVDSTIGKLRAIFNSLDRSGDYDVRSGGGNPATHFTVKQYLKSVQKEQADARISPRQATPLFFDKFHQIVLHLRSVLTDPASTAINKYIYARDLTFFILEFYTGQRASDLGRLKTIDILQHPNGKSLLIHQRVGKSIRGSRSRPVPIHPLGNPAICPVQNLKFYKTLCTAMKIDLGTGFLFRATSHNVSISSSPFLAPAAQARLVTYLKLLDLYTDETVHGFRGGTALLLSMLGASSEDIARHIGWCSSAMVDHYTQVDKVFTAMDTADRLSGSILPSAGQIPAEVLGGRFNECNNLIGFEPFF